MTDGPGRHRQAPSRLRNLVRRRQRALTALLIAAAAAITVGAIGLAGWLHGRPAGNGPVDTLAPPSNAPTPQPGTLLGVYRPGVPGSYAGIQAFTAATGVRPGVVVYYSGWM